MNRSFSLILLFALFLTACSGGVPAANKESAEKMTEYVGEIPEAEFFVAIAVGASGDVLAYVCNGMGNDYLFRGTLQNASVNLNSADSQANLRASLEGVAYSGTFSKDGKSYPFTTVPAQDYGGLYHVTALSEFEAEGISQGGATLKMNLTPDKERVQVKVTTLDGKTLSYDRPWPAGHDHSEPTEYTESWVIFLNDSSSRGGHIKSSLRPGIRRVNLIDPIDNP
jgi:hypothetical protein